MLDDKSIENLIVSQDNKDEDENMKNDELLLQSQDKVYFINSSTILSLFYFIEFIIKIKIIIG